MARTRASGILLHPTSFPGGGGIGELGSRAYQWVDWLAAAGQSVWQILPLNPTGYGDSPYASFSAFAGNPLLISLELLVQGGLLTAEETAQGDDFPTDTVAFGAVIPWKFALLRTAYERAVENGTPELRAAFVQFCAEQGRWLDDYALFSALKTAFDGKAWNEWDAPIRQREAPALNEWRDKLGPEIQFQQFLQFLFFTHWLRLKKYANDHGIRVFGDAPIFVAFDSADVWSQPEMFYLDESGAPTVIAGVPPDYFSETGQRWGNPLYRWDVQVEQGYAWWIERVRHTLTMLDVLRIDHFRGFEAYWEIPATEPTAVKGRWVKGPGVALFHALRQALPALPIVAEDLGVITAEVEAIRDEMGFPGMKVLQFAWAGDNANADLPHNHVPNSVVYTGTHDNDTTVGWYTQAGEIERAYFGAYTNDPGDHPAFEMLRLAWQSVSSLAIAPLQDVLQLGSETRMNYPGRESGNWGWRYDAAVLTPELAAYLHNLSIVYGRTAPPPRELSTFEQRREEQKHAATQMDAEDVAG